MARVRDLLSRAGLKTLVGREQQIGEMERLLTDERPLVMFVHGIGGVGKSHLLDAFAEIALERAAHVVRIDCATVEPTEAGFLAALGQRAGGGFVDADAAGHWIEEMGGRVLLMLDRYEVFRLLDTWLRQEFAPALPTSARLVISGREAPSAPWLTAGEWDGLVSSVPLGPLRGEDAVRILRHAGMSDEQAVAMNRVCKGHPLALVLARSMASREWDGGNPRLTEQRVIEELTHFYIEDVEPRTRRILEASSVVRRVTRSLLRAMLPDEEVDAYDRIAALPFVEEDYDGLMLHDAVRVAIASSLRASDPASYGAYRRAAWMRLRDEVRQAPRGDLWRYTADMLYQVSNTIVHGAFFPSEPHTYVVEPAMPDDWPSIASLRARRAGADDLALLEAWWREEPATFRVVRDGQNEVVGYFTLFEPISVKPAAMRDQPLLQSWLRHLRDEPVGRTETVLFCHSSSTVEPEGPSPIGSAIWLDVKRAYMELRPHLRRIYASVFDAEALAPAMTPLGFRLLDDRAVDIGGRTVHVFMNDFGPQSIDGWLARLVGDELGVAEVPLLDQDARDLVFDGRRVPLTKLEYEVMERLVASEGRAVSRIDLLEQVWGYRETSGSNVVDVVIRGLRKKLGERAECIETVHGLGYRLNLA